MLSETWPRYGVERVATPPSIPVAVRLRAPIEADALSGHPARRAISAREMTLVCEAELLINFERKSARL
ncbi:unnamed protein product, partial [Iphiclides podalirius]